MTFEQPDDADNVDRSESVLGPSQTLLLRTQSALTSPGNYGVFDRMGGTQLPALSLLPAFGKSLTNSTS